MADVGEHERAMRERAGQALRILRKRAGYTQEDAAGRALGISLPSWKNYESGKRFMDNPTLARALAAIGATADEHAVELARMASTDRLDRSFDALEARGRAMALPVGGIAHGGALRPNLFDEGQEAEVIDFASFLAPGTRVLRTDGMSMVPYAEPGGFVTYNPRRPARRGQGAVIEFRNGAYAVKRFERTDDTHLYATELYPVEREVSWPLDEIVGAYAIGLRGD